ncbi:MAG: T9SS type A sorting domain-containing protein [Ignavibacteria bacterium]|jgi:hypothetical protein|nr:T9SS type A sorting domain-containing protein [Ignavibacteria bacterium]
MKVRGYSSSDYGHFDLDYWLKNGYYKNGDGEDVVIMSYSISPNPTSDMVTLDATNIMGESIIEVMDLRGNIVYTSMVVSDGTLEYTIDMSRFTAGAYFVRLTKNLSYVLNM